MPPRPGPSRDPFNFDEIFTAVGADNFVKKPLAELKKQNTASSSPSVAAVPQPAPQPAAATTFTRQGSAATITTDPFASLIAPPKETPIHGNPYSKPIANNGVSSSTTAKAPYSSSGIGAFDFDDVFGGPASSSTHVPTTEAVASTADPFAAFGDVDGTMPTVHAASPSSQPNTGSGNLLGLDDFHAPSPAPAATTVPVTIQPTSSSGLQSDRVQAVEQFAVPPGPLEQGLHRQQQAVPAAAASSGSFFADFDSSPVPQQAQQPPPQQQQKQQDVAGSNGLSQGGLHDAGRVQHKHSFSGAEEHEQHRRQQLQQRPYEAEHGPRTSASSNSGSGLGGITSMLKGLGKKAVKAAQAGLQTLETALERIDQSGSQQQQQPQRQQQHIHHSDSLSWVDSRNGAAPAAKGYDYVADDDDSGWASFQGSDAAQQAFDEEDALNAALTLSALPAHERTEVLATLPPALAVRVQEILREQELVRQQQQQRQAPSGLGSVPTSSSQVVHTAEFKLDDYEYQSVGPSTVSSSGAGPSASSASAAAVPRAASLQQLASSRPGTPAAPVSPAPSPAAAPAAPASLVDMHEDLLGVGHSTAAHQPVASAAAPVMDDLLGFGDHHQPSTVAAPAASRASSLAAPAATAPPSPAPAAAPHVRDVDDMHDFFAGGSTSGAPAPAAAPAAAAPSTAAASSLDDFFAGAGSSKAKPAAAAGGSSKPVPSSHSHSVLNLMEENVDITGHEELYEEEQGQEGEPELRRQLRAARIAEKHAKMKAALAEKLAKDEEEARRREQQVELKEQFKDAVNVWKNKHKGNIRGLLASLHTVLWEDSGWAPVGMGDLLEKNQVKRVYMKANLLVHPDKVRQRNGTATQVAIADMVFDVLKVAWELFQAQK